MQRFYNLTSNGIKIIMFVIFSVFLIGMLFIRSVYQWDDSPAFFGKGILDYGMLLLNAGLFFMVWKTRNVLERKINVWYITGVFFFLSIGYIWLVPLKPFSDMDQIYQAALSIADGDFHAVCESGYFNTYPNNLMITYLFGLLLFIFPNSFVTIKVFNIILTIFIAYMIVRLAECFIHMRYKKLLYTGALSFVSVFLYCNHLYTDTLFTALSLLAIYFYVKNKRNLYLCCLLLSVSYFIRPVGAIYLVAVLIVELFKESTKWKEKLLRIGLSVFTVFICCGVIQGGINTQLKDRQMRIPAASYLQMGFNKEEFGFQDNTHSPDYTLKDVKEKITSHSAKALSLLLIKKGFWTWTEGTYQAERYGFGQMVEDELEKFQYQTVVTKYLKNPEQKAYKWLEAFMREQYFCLCCVALAGALVVRKNRKWDLFVLLFVGFFLFYLVWEMKSRYLISLYPFLFIFAVAYLNQKDKKANSTK